jgi:hypothetical protein
LPVWATTPHTTCLAHPSRRRPAPALVVCLHAPVGGARFPPCCAAITPERCLALRTTHIHHAPCAACRQHAGHHAASRARNGPGAWCRHVRAVRVRCGGRSQCLRERASRCCMRAGSFSTCARCPQHTAAATCELCGTPRPASPNGVPASLSWSGIACCPALPGRTLGQCRRPSTPATPQQTPQSMQGISHATHASLLRHATHSCPIAAPIAPPGATPPPLHPPGTFTAACAPNQPPWRSHSSSPLPAFALPQPRPPAAARWCARPQSTTMS